MNSQNICILCLTSYLTVRRFRCGSGASDQDLARNNEKIGRAKFTQNQHMSRVHRKRSSYFDTRTALNPITARTTDERSFPKLCGT